MKNNFISLSNVRNLRKISQGGVTLQTSTPLLTSNHMELH